MTQQYSSADGSIFLSNVTLIDAAYIDSTGRPRGLSVSPVFEVRGAITGDEQVVVDFSKCRKMLKTLIDDRESGYDHKLLVDTDYTLITAVRDNTANADVMGYSIKTDFVDLSVPINAIRITSLGWADPSNLQQMLDSLAADMSSWLTDRLKDLNVIVTVHLPAPYGAVTAPAYPVKPTDCVIRQPFSYTHGLPFSSSWGCQNILHGHTSFIDVVVPKENRHLARALLQSIADALDNIYIYDTTHADYLFEGLNFRTAVHQYTTERGPFRLTLNGVSEVGLPCAPTIENIVTHVARTYAPGLIDAGCTTLAISEGLWKGSLINRPDANWMDV